MSFVRMNQQDSRLDAYKSLERRTTPNGQLIYMNKQAEATLMQLLLEIIQDANVYSQTKAVLLQKLISEVQDEKQLL